MIGKKMKLFPVVLLALAPSVSAAATLTFDNIPTFEVDLPEADLGEVGYVYEEQGFEVRGEVRRYYFGGFSNLHFDLAGEGDWHRSYSISSADGSLFGLEQMFLTGGGYQYTRFGDNLRIRGFREGSFVDQVTASFYLPSRTVEFGPNFFGFDRIIIEANPDCNCPLDLEAYGYMLPDYHFSIDDVVLTSTRPDVAAVPLPATAWLLLTALFGLGARRLRSKAV